MPSYADINIQLVKKSQTDIENVIKYMNKTKKCHKDKSEIMNQNFKQQNLEVKPESEVKKLSIFDFKINSETKTSIKSK